MTFRVPKIKSCCCLSLKTGSIILSTVQLLLFFAMCWLAVLVSPKDGAIRHFIKFTYDSMVNTVIVTTVFLLYGIAKKDPLYIFPWIIQQTVMSAVATYSYLMQFLSFAMQSFTAAEALWLLPTIFFVCSLLVVYNHYRELEEALPETI